MWEEKHCYAEGVWVFPLSEGYQGNKDHYLKSPSSQWLLEIDWNQIIFSSLRPTDDQPAGNSKNLTVFQSVYTS